MQITRNHVSCCAGPFRMTQPIWNLTPINLFDAKFHEESKEDTLWTSMSDRVSLSKSNCSEV